MIPKKYLYSLSFFTAILTLAAYFGNLRFENIFSQSIQIIFGSIFILFLPGYFLTLLFFKNTEIDFLERFALSFALSISVIPLLSFYINLLGIPINFFSIYTLVCGIIILSIGRDIFMKKT